MIKNKTAYWIDGDFYVHDGKPSKKIKKKIIEKLKTEKIDTFYFENQEEKNGNRKFENTELGKWWKQL